jgi:hypothetical protein
MKKPKTSKADVLLYVILVVFGLASMLVAGMRHLSGGKQMASAKFWNSPFSMLILVPTILGFGMWQLATGRRA